MASATNRFVEQQLRVAIETEKEIICLYARVCHMSLQFLNGSHSVIDLIEPVMEELAANEVKLRHLVVALERIGISGDDACGLSEQERQRLFEDYFAQHDFFSLDIDELFAQSDIQEILDEIRGP